MKSDNVTITDARLHNALDKKINKVIDKRNIPDMIKKQVTDAKIHTGKLLKFYHHKDKALVRLSTNEEVICKILHRLDGSMIDFFTPEGELEYCELMKEPCIMPRRASNVLVLDINDNTKEQLILGFYQPDDIIYTTPAEQGHYKIVNLGATNQIGLDIGEGQVNISSYEGVGFTEGLYHRDNVEIQYANSEDVYDKDDVYSKDEVYTKEEVNELIEQLRTELGDEDSGNTS